MDLKILAVTLFLAGAVTAIEEGCFVDGELYGEGDVIPTSNNCEVCKCVYEENTFKVRCKDVVCPTLECQAIEDVDGKCCPQCKEEGCFVDGELYGEGDVIPTSNNCEVCKCVYEENIFKLRCKDVVCPTLECQAIEDVDGKCCPQCKEEGCFVDGELYGEGDVIPTSNNCEVCKCVYEENTFKVRCKDVVCPTLECQAIEDVDGKCCPQCKDCSGVKCRPRRKCPKGYILKTPKGECCPECVRDCSAVSCIQRDCPNAYIPEGECCKQCPVCPDGEPLANYFCGKGGKPCPKGYFCNIAPNDAYAVCCKCPKQCPDLNCEPGFEPKYQPGECCQTCVSVCPYGAPLANYFCGRGGKRCPKGYFCKIAPNDAYAVCCEGCLYNGVHYALGSSFQDGCKRCRCKRDGTVSCSKKNCGCTYKGATYPVGWFDDGCLRCLCKKDGTVVCKKKKNCVCTYKGASYPVGWFDDGCLRCQCKRDGTVVCKKKKNCEEPCIVDGTTYPSGVDFYVQCNKCTCTDGEITCTKKLCEKGCYKNGELYLEGAKVPSDDPCEECFCELFDSKFNIVCATLDCPKLLCNDIIHVKGKCCPECKGGCTYKGVTYPIEVSFYDECNPCTCNKDRTVTCTKIACDSFCESGLTPLEGEICGGIAGTPCKTEGYECDYSNLDPDVVDGSGICCKAYQCQNGRDPLRGTHCDEQNVCPTGFNCETDGEVGFCCLDCSTAKCSPLECKYPVVSETRCCPYCPDPDPTCTVNGVTYQPGDTFFIECNECTCRNGVPSCTQKACEPGCYQDGIRYGEGDKVPTPEDEPCLTDCRCSLTEGTYKITCASLACAPCDNPIPVEGQCCPDCDDP